MEVDTMIDTLKNLAALAADTLVDTAVLSVGGGPIMKRQVL